MSFSGLFKRLMRSAWIRLAIILRACFGFWGLLRFSTILESRACRRCLDWFEYGLFLGSLIKRPTESSSFVFSCPENYFICIRCRKAYIRPFKVEYSEPGPHGFYESFIIG